jgi:hypothetical protein
VGPVVFVVAAGGGVPVLLNVASSGAVWGALPGPASSANDLITILTDDST